MNTYRRIARLQLTLIVAACATTIASANVRADDVFKSEPTETRVIHLAHARAAQVSGVVVDMFMQCAIGVDHRTNSIIASCPTDDLEKIQRLVAQLDVEGGQDYEQVFMQVPRVSSGLKEMLNAAMSDGSRLAIDEESKTVGVWGTNNDVRRAREVIATLQANREAADINRDPDARSTYRVSFFYVSAHYNPSDADVELPPLPQKLEPVRETLLESGFQNLQLLASMVVLAHQDQHFELEGLVDLSDQGESGAIEVEVNGSLFEDEGDLIQLELETQLIRNGDANGRGRDRSSLFQLNTTIQCGLDEYLVLSATPAGARLFDAVALVVQISAVGRAPQ